MEDVGQRVDDLARELPRRYPPGLANGAMAVVDVRPDGRAEVRAESVVPAVR